MTTITIDTFINMAKSLFERTGKLDSGGGRKLWAMVVDGKPHAAVMQLLEDYAYKGDHFPSPKGFAEELSWRTRSGVDLPQDIECSPEGELCDTCQEPNWWYKQGEQKIRMRGSGGLLFRFYEGQWYACRCYTCGGPERHKDLSIPQPMFRPHWKPWGATEPLKALRLAAERRWFDSGAQRRDEALEALTGWLGEAVANSLQRLASV